MQKKRGGSCRAKALVAPWLVVTAAVAGLFVGCSPPQRPLLSRPDETAPPPLGGAGGATATPEPPSQDGPSGPSFSWDRDAAVPVVDAPFKDAPTKDAPFKDAPTKDAPFKDAPSVDGPDNVPFDAGFPEAPIDIRIPDAQTCAEEAHVGELVGADVLILLDRSGSMSGTKWTSSIQALTNFVKDPKSAGLGVALQFFPNLAGYYKDCDIPTYAMPAVPLTTLPAGESSLTSSLSTTQPGGSTPMQPAVNGSFQYLRQHLASKPGRRAVLVLVSDGEPGGCTGETPAAIEALIRQAQMMTPSISTYMIGVYDGFSGGMGVTNANNFAMAGGTMKPFVLDPNMGLGTAFVDALNAIRGSVLPCDYKIPAPKSGSVDYDRVAVRADRSTGPEDVGYVKDETACDPVKGGWYYDVHPLNGTPTRVLLCKNSCDNFKLDKTVKVQLLFKCSPQ